MNNRLSALRYVLLLSSFGVLPMMVGCTPETYLSGYSYYPQPAVVNVAKRTAPNQIPLTVLASIVGLHNADQKHQVPYSIDTRLRFENNGPVTVVFDPRTLELVTGTLRPFSAPIVQPPGVLTLRPGDRQDVNASFAFPPNMQPSQVNLNNLRLRWTVMVDNYPVPQTALFERTGNGYAAPPPDSPDYTY